MQDVMFAFDRSKLKDWVADIKQLIKKDLRGIPGWGAHTRCAVVAAAAAGRACQPSAWLGLRFQRVFKGLCTEQSWLLL